MATTYAILKKGEYQAVDYTPGSAVTAGDVVVIASRNYIAHRDIAANALGSLAASGGVYTFPKTAGSTTAIAAGTKVYWDATNKVATATSSGNTVLGYVVPAGSADADTTVDVVHDPSA